jgi:hypothetical protein
MLSSRSCGRLGLATVAMLVVGLAIAVHPVSASTAPQAKKPPKTRWYYLADRPWVESNFPYIRTGPGQTNGKTYTHSVIHGNWAFHDTGFVQYDLKRRCYEFRYTTGISDDSSSESKAQFEIYGDRRRLSKFKLEFGQTRSQALKVKNALRLKLATANAGDTVAPDIVWGDARVRCTSL